MKNIILCISLLLAINIEAAVITNWAVQLPNAVPETGSAILMQQGGVTYYFTPEQFSAAWATNSGTGTSSNIIANLNGSGTNTTFYGTTVASSYSTFNDPSPMVKVDTDTGITPTTPRLALVGNQNAVRIWTGDRPMAEPYLDVYVRTNTSETAKVVRLYRWTGRIINLATNATVYLGTTNGATLTACAMVAPAALLTPSGVTNYLACHQAGPPYWAPTTPQIVLPSNGMAFTILTNRAETPVFVSEFDGIRWSPPRWYITETNASLTIQCTYRAVAIASYGGNTIRAVAPTGSTIGGAPQRMSLVGSSASGRVYYVNTTSNFLTAITNAILGDTILLADGTYTATQRLTHVSFLANTTRGNTGPEGITIRGASGNRQAVILNCDFEMFGSGMTLPSLWKDLTFDYAWSTNFFSLTDGKIIFENVRFQNNAFGKQLVLLNGSSELLTADFLWCSLVAAGDDCLDANGTSLVRLIGCDGSITTNAANSQVLSAHNTSSIEIYGGSYGSAVLNVLANASDASPIWAFFSTVYLGTNHAGVATTSVFGCVLEQDSGVVFQHNTNGYALFSEIHRNCDADFAPTFRAYSHNRIYNNFTYAAQVRRGQWKYDGNLIFSSSGVAALRVRDFLADSGQTTWLNNTLYGASPLGWDFGDTNLFGRLTNNATLNCATSINIDTALATWVLGDYNVFDPTVDTDYTTGANDIVSGNAALDARYIPTVAGNCDGNGGFLGIYGDSDPYGAVLMLHNNMVPRGARARQRSGGFIFPDIY